MRRRDGSAQGALELPGGACLLHPVLCPTPPRQGLTRTPFPCPTYPLPPLRVQNDGGLSHALNRIHARTNNPDRALVAAFKEVSTICDHLKVKGGVKDRACEEYKAVVEVRHCAWGRGQVG